MTLLLFILALPLILSLLVVALSFFKKESDSQKKWWRHQVLVAYDQLVNTFFMGWADESISSRCYRLSLNGNDYGRSIIDRIFFWEEEHCRQSYESEKERLQLPPELRGD